MITRLQLKNFVVVPEANVIFDKGLTVITGETGSGKSVLLSAIKFALGSRAEPYTVRRDASAAEVILDIDISASEPALEWLKQSGFPIQKHSRIHRILNANMRGKITLNGKAIVANQLRAFSELVLQLHGQHQQQSLLKTSEHRRLLDAYADNHAIRQSVKSAYQAWLSLVERRELLRSQANNKGDFALLKYQAEELAALNLTPEEWNQLNLTHKKLANVSDHQLACQKALSILKAEDNNAILEALHTVRSVVSSLERNNLSTLLDGAKIHIEEAIADLESTQSQLTVDPEALEQTEKRLSILFDMARKHQVQPEALYEHFCSLRTKLESLENAEIELSSLNEEIASALKTYESIAKKLSQSRLKTAKILSDKVTEKLCELGMSGSHFKVCIYPNENMTPSPSGIETISFEASCNPDQPILPINKVASGGELSRIALAIEAITAKHLQTPALIFDEIDVGISGKTGAVVGKALSCLSIHSQVVCVTHLPQVAAFASGHIRVHKQHEGNKTIVSVDSVTANDRVEELARMLGGFDITDQTRAHAKELISYAKKLFAEA